MADLQELVDDLALAIGRPIAVDDRRWRLLAASAHAREPDAVRRTSLITRSAVPEVAAWLESLGLLRARDAVATPRNDELDMAERWCVPLRHGDRLLGFLWVITADRPLGEAERTEVSAAAAARACAELWRRVSEADDRRARIRTLAADPTSPGAAAALAAALGWPPAARFAVAVMDAHVDLRRTPWPGGEALPIADDTLLVHLRTASPSALASALSAAGAAAVGVSSAHTDLTALASATREAHRARLAARAASSAPSASTVSAASIAPSAFAAWDDLGAWSLVTELWDGAGRPAPPPAIQTLATHRQGPDLLAALQAVLDAAGDVTAAAATLHLHRATLYRRLERIETLTGLSLSSGDDRLLLHLGLRLHHLHRAAETP